MADLQLAVILDESTSFAAHGEEVTVLGLYEDWKRLIGQQRENDDEVGAPVSMPVEVTRMQES